MKTFLIGAILCLLAGQVFALPLTKKVNTVGDKSKDGYKITYYWTATKKEVSADEPTLPVVGLGGKLLGWAPISLIKSIAMEGSGYLPDGTLINLACGCAYPNARFFVVDRKKSVWGLDSRSKPLIPFQSIAVDPKVIPLGSKVFISVYKGLKLPDGRKHTGCFLAADIGYHIKGNHIDVFAGTYENYLLVSKSTDELEVAKVQSSADCELLGEKS